MLCKVHWIFNAMLDYDFCLLCLQISVFSDHFVTLHDNNALSLKLSVNVPLVYTIKCKC